MLNTPYTRWTGDNLHGRTPMLTPAWVRLDEVFPRHPDDPLVVVPDGLDTSGSVPAWVSGWFRAATGEWLAVVNFKIRYADGRRDEVMLHDQLVHSRALRPREDHQPL